jgi:hypothetical protein
MISNPLGDFEDWRRAAVLKLKDESRHIERRSVKGAGLKYA